MSQFQIDLIVLKFGIITGAIFYLIYALCCYFGRKKALKKITYTLQEGETIIYKSKFGFLFDFFLPFGIGMFIGALLLPVWLYDSIQYVAISNLKVVTKANLPFFALGETISIAICFAMASFNIVLTNFRVIGSSAVPFLNKLGYINIEYSDIDSIMLEKRGIFSSFYVKTKNVM